MASATQLHDEEMEFGGVNPILLFMMQNNLHDVMNRQPGQLTCQQCVLGPVVLHSHMSHRGFVCN